MRSNAIGWLVCLSLIVARAAATASLPVCPPFADEVVAWSAGVTHQTDALGIIDGSFARVPPGDWIWIKFNSYVIRAIHD